MNSKRLVRFLAKDGRTYYGDAILPQGSTDIGKAKQARVIKGDVLGKHEVTDEIADIRVFLSPLAPDHVRTVRCLGLNYAKHAEESGLPLPQYPVLFVSPHFLVICVVAVLTWWVLSTNQALRSRDLLILSQFPPWLRKAKVSTTNASWS